MNLCFMAVAHGILVLRPMKTNFNITYFKRDAIKSVFTFCTGLNYTEVIPRSFIIIMQQELCLLATDLDFK